MEQKGKQINKKSAINEENMKHLQQIQALAHKLDLFCTYLISMNYKARQEESKEKTHRKVGNKN